MVTGLQESWAKLDDKQKAKYQKLLVIAGSFCALILIFSLKDNPTPTHQAPQELIAVQPLNHFDAKSFREDLQYKQQKLIDTQTTALAKQNKQMQQLAEKIQQLQQQLQEQKTTGEQEESITKPQPHSNPTPVKDQSYPSAHLPASYPPTTSLNQELALDVQPRLIGGITKVVIAAKADDKKQSTDKKVFILPPGFFSARTMEGIEVGSGFNASSNPQPLLLRIQTPATLPNSVKSNIKGCFVVANATGSLSKERIEFRTVSLNCISKDKQSLLTANIKGHVTDIDGKQGLSARVVSKTGHALGYAFLAKFVEGIGQGYAAKFPNSTPTTNLLTGETNPVTVTDTQIAQSGISAGIGSSSAMLSEYYLDIVKQLTPVLETGAGREVTIVMTAQAKLTSQPIQTTE